MDNIFLPIVMQRISGASPTLSREEVRAQGVEQTKVLLWNIIRGRRLTQAREKQQACITASPIAMAFARQRGATVAPQAPAPPGAGDRPRT